MSGVRVCVQGYQPLGQLVAALQHFQKEVEPLKQAVRSSRWMCVPLRLAAHAQCTPPMLANLRMTTWDFMLC